MSDLKNIFLEEAEELLGQIEPLILDLEKKVTQELLDELFRVVHTLKGSAGIAGVKGIGKLTHHLEDLLDGLRDGEIEARPGLVDLLLMGFDYIKVMVADLAGGQDSPPPEELLEEIAAYIHRRLPASCFAEKKTEQPEAVTAPLQAAVTEAAEHAAQDEVRRFLLDKLRKGKNVYHLTLDFGLDFFRQGHNLSYLMEDLVSLGTIAGLKVDSRRIPPLSLLNPENCHLLFTLYLVTGEDRETVEDTFVFVSSDENKIVVRLVDEEELNDAPLLEFQAPTGELPAAEQSLPLSGQRLLYAVKVLRQQEKALRLADEEVLPGLLPVVQRVLERLAGCINPGLEQRLFNAREEGREQLLKITGKLLAVLGSDVQAGMEQLSDMPAASCSKPINAGKPGVSGLAVSSPEERRKSNITGEGRQATFKVRRETADALMNLSGELLIAKNSLPYLVKKLEMVGMGEQAGELKERCLYLDRIAREIHERVMDIWLLPIQEVFSRFPRFVRDQAKILDKKVEIITGGGETRLDRNIIEEIYEPLLHLVRNALDHGLEEPGERMKTGKNPVGVISLTAQRYGERVVIRVSDDGRGIDVDTLTEKAVSGGIVSREKVSGMTAQEKLGLIFLPGLSSKEGISDLSGRGVGMDAVENAVNRLGGSIQVESTPGQGTIFTVSLPFTMATSEVLMVRIGDRVYGIPLSAVRETVRVEGKDLRTMCGRPVALLRGEIVPLLESCLYLEDASACKDETVLVVLWQGSALPVDTVLGKEVIIVKPLTGELKKLSVFMGAAVLGDGRVLLVLDPNELVRISLGSREREGILHAGGN